MSAEVGSGPTEVPPLQVRLFGRLRVQVHGRPLPPLRTRKGEWLLALLCLSAGKELERRTLAGHLWPESAEPQALAGLRRALTDLRTALGDEAERIESPTQRTLRVEPAGAWIDVREFRRLVGTGTPEALEEAAALYEGPLLEDCDEEWAETPRDSLRAEYRAALGRLAACAEEKQRPDEAESWLRRLLQDDPFDEEVLRRLLRAHAAAGRRVQARRTYLEWRRRLDEELGVEPDLETLRLVESLEEPAPTGPGEPPASTIAEPAGAPPPVVPGALPRPLSSLVGREEAVAELAGRLTRERLLTLAGPGGIGKTRLALAVAERVRDRFPSGAWFVELDSVTEAALLPQVVAARLGLMQQHGVIPTSRLAGWLAGRRLLLVLDNCEHLVEAVSELVGELLDECPDLAVLTTSREALGLGGESVYRVPPLPLAGVADGPAPAVRLFLERARAQVAEFVLDDESRDYVEEICRSLDGIPLAIELAAARLRVLSPREIAERLNDRFRLLVNPERGAPARRRTLWATVDWSYQLLPEPERALFRRLSVFRGSFSLDDLCRVCELDTDQGLETLTHLVDRSLVVSETRSGTSRYRLLETTREFARQCLEEAEEAGAAEERHAAHFLEVAEAARHALAGPAQQEWLDRLEASAPDLRAALARLVQEPLDWRRVAAAQRLASGITRFWLDRGYLVEGQTWLQRVLRHNLGRTLPRTLALEAAAAVAVRTGDAHAAERYAREALLCAESCGDRPMQAAALEALGSAANLQRRYPEAEELLGRALEIRREVGEPGGIAATLNSLGFTLYCQRKLDEAAALYQESLGLNRETGDRSAACRNLNCLGLADMVRRRIESARDYFHRSLELAHQLGHRDAVATATSNLGILLFGEGRFAEAEQCYRRAVEISAETGNLRGLAIGLSGLAELHGARGDRPDLAARLYGGSEGLRERLGMPIPSGHTSEYEALRGRQKELLGDERWDELWWEGASLPLEGLLALARTVPEPDGF